MSHLRDDGLLSDETVLCTHDREGKPFEPPPLLTPEAWEQVERKTGMSELECWETYCEESRGAGGTLTAGEYRTMLETSSVRVIKSAWTTAFPSANSQYEKFIRRTDCTVPAYAQPNTSMGYSHNPTRAFERMPYRHPEGSAAEKESLRGGDDPASTQTRSGRTVRVPEKYSR